MRVHVPEPREVADDEVDPGAARKARGLNAPGDHKEIAAWRSAESSPIDQRRGRRPPSAGASRPTDDLKLPFAVLGRVLALLKIATRIEFKGLIFRQTAITSPVSAIQ